MVVYIPMLLVDTLLWIAFLAPPISIPIIVIWLARFIHRYEIRHTALTLRVETAEKKNTLLDERVARMEERADAH